MKKLLFLLVLILFIPTFVNAADIKTYSADDFFSEARVGWNLGNSLDSHYKSPGAPNLSEETVWGNPKVSQELIDFVQAQGFNVIRIPVTWSNHTYKESNVIYEEWLDRVKEVVDYAYNKGMYVMINTHHDDKVLYAGINDQIVYNEVKATAADYWRQIANKFKDYDEHLIFEAYNEIDNKQNSWVFSDFAAKQVNTLNQIFVDTVRSTGGNNRYRLLVISPLLMDNSTQAINAVQVPTDSVNNKLILSVHMYSGQEDEMLTYAFKRINEAAASKGLRVMITEFGNTTSYTPISHRAINLSNFVARAYEQGIISVIWDNGSDYSIVNRKDLSNSKFDLIEAVTNPYKYSNPKQGVIYNKYDQLYYKRVNADGTFDEKNLPEWWGVWINEELIPIKENQHYMSVYVHNNTNVELFNLHGIYFFDENKEPLYAYRQNFPGYTSTKFSIPEGAKYFRFEIYNCKVNTKPDFVKEALANGNFYFTYNTYGIDELVKEKVEFGNKVNESISSSTYKVSNKNIYVVPNLFGYIRIKDFKNNISSNKSYVIYDNNNQVVSDDVYIGTGYKIVVDNVTYHVIILGDVTGDGRITLADVSKLYNHYKTGFVLSDYYLEAGKLVNLNKISLGDIAKLYNMYMEIKKH